MNMIMKQIVSRLINTPVKSLLTILSIALGVMVVTLTLNMNFKLSKLVKDTQNKTITNVINSEKPNSGNIDFGKIDISLGTKEIISELKTSLEGIKYVSSFVPWVNNTFYYNQNKYNVKSSYATQSPFISIYNIEIQSGNVFNDNDGAMEVLVSSEVSEVLFGRETAIGKILSIPETYKDDNDEMQVKYRNFTVVGVFKTPIPIVKEKNGIPDLIYSISGYLGEYESGLQLIVEFEKKFSDNSKVKLTKAIKRILGEDTELVVWHGRPNSTEEKIWYENIITLINIVFILFGFIALLVSSFGVFSMTTVSILERNKEIGLKRALGGTRFHIIIQFLIEAVITILIGSIPGIILAMIFSPLFISNILPSITGGQIDLSVGMNMGLNPLAALLSILVAVISGGLFGLFPSLTAAKSQPIEAIREN